MAINIDLLNLQPTVITRDLSNKYLLLAAPLKEIGPLNSNI